MSGKNLSFDICNFNPFIPFWRSLLKLIAQSAGAVEYIDGFSAER